MLTAFASGALFYTLDPTYLKIFISIRINIFASVALGQQIYSLGYRDIGIWVGY